MAKTGVSEARFEHEGNIERENGEVLLALDDAAEKSGEFSDIKLANDGRTILVPQPSDDPGDPLNWSPFKKHMILLCVAFGAFAGDFGSGAGIPATAGQSAAWHLTAVSITRATNLNVIMCGASGIVWMPLFNYWGRIPVLFWTSVLGLLFTLGCVLSTSFDSYYPLRAFQGLTQSIGQTIGLAFIKDIFFYHEQARKVGIWYSIFIISPVFGPFVGNFMYGRLHVWQPIFWLVFAWSAFVITMIIVFGDEPYYNRLVPMEQQPVRPKSQVARLLRVAGVWQIRNRQNHYYLTLIRCYGRLLEVFLKPIIPMTMLFYSMTFMWTVGINITSPILLQTPIKAGGYGFGPTSLGYIYFIPIVGIIIGSLFGHWFNDYVAERYIKRHNGVFVPEARLWTPYIGASLMIPGLVLVGQTLHSHLHWVGLIFGWGMAQVGIMLISVAIVTFALNCYPNAPVEVSALINLGRVAAGFSVGYFQQAWGQLQGYDVTFGLQAVVVAGSFVLLFCIQYFGARIRAWSGPVRPV